MLTNLSVYAIIKIQRNPDNTFAEKYKKSTHRVVARDTLCVFASCDKTAPDDTSDTTGAEPSDEETTAQTLAETMATTWLICTYDLKE